MNGLKKKILVLIAEMIKITNQQFIKQNDYDDFKKI